MKEGSWKDQLEKRLIEEKGDGNFGTNIDWDIKDVRSYITKLEKLGAYDIEIPDYDTIQFRLPPISTRDPAIRSTLLEFILLSSPRPCDAVFIKNKHPRGRMLSLSWDW